jgi:hypothetical protein
MRGAVGYFWRVLLAAALLTGISLVSYAMRHQFEDFAQSQANLEAAVGWLCLSKSLVAVMLAYVAVRSRWSGTQLMAAIFVAYFGIGSFIGQAMLLLAGRLAPSTAALLTAHGFMVALLSSFALVVLMGRVQDQGFVAESARLHLPASEWLLKLLTCVAVWLLLSSVLRGPADLLIPWQRMALQAVRAVFVAVFVLPVIKMLRGGRLETALTVGVLLPVLGVLTPAISRHLLLPGEQLALGRTLAHAVANMAYGFLVGFLFSRRAEPA